ncbi:MAG: cell division initiation protein [Actinomycetota bacterium]
MDLTPETLRTATFRDKLRGYHPDDVDEFLESVARGLDVLLARLRDATEKARSVAPAEPPPQTDEAVKTLALAQRTADLAIHEAKTEAERLMKAAEQKARHAISTAEESAAQIAENAQAELRADLERLQAARDQLSTEVQALGSWLEGERGRIRRALIDVADRVDNVRDSGDAPTPKPVSVPAPPRQKLDEERAAGTNVPAPRSEPSRAAPPVDRSKANAVPPLAAPAPHPQRQATPPGGQPAIRPSPAVAPVASRPEPSPADSAVLSRAHQAIAAESKAESKGESSKVESKPDDDPFFAELRAAMLDTSPLGPRDDEDSNTSQ